jgi:hypothetical protein
MVDRDVNGTRGIFEELANREGLNEGFAWWGCTQVYGVKSRVFTSWLVSISEW